MEAALKKKCIRCSKEIPASALHCVFCSVKQPSDGDAAESGIRRRTMIGAAAPDVPIPHYQTSAEEPGATATPDAADAIPAGPASAAQGAPSRGQAALTRTIAVVPPPGGQPAGADGAPAGDGARSPADAGAGADGVPAGARTAARGALPADGSPGSERAASSSATAGATASATDHSAAPGGSTARRATATSARGGAAARDAGLARAVAAAGGLLVLLFLAGPFGGQRAWAALATLRGASWVLQLSVGCAGLVLLAAGLLPLPARFRALVAWAVGTLPLLLVGGARFGAPFSDLGVAGRAALGALALTTLAGAAWALSRQGAARPPRLVATAAAVALLLAYTVPGARGLPLGRLLAADAGQAWWIALVPLLGALLAPLMLWRSASGAARVPWGPFGALLTGSTAALVLAAGGAQALAPALATLGFAVASAGGLAALVDPRAQRV